MKVTRREWMAGLAAGSVLWAQEEEDRYRAIWDSGLRSKRPPAAVTGPGGGPVVRVPKPRYEAAGSGPRPAPGTGDVIGLTIWKMREPRADEGDAPRLLVFGASKKAKLPMVAERLQPSLPLRAGDKVRLSIEVAREGFLYLIDRELYRDGRRGAPYLLFPSRRVRGGNNAVRAGMLVDIPSQEDEPLSMEPQGGEYAGEELSILVTARQLDLAPAGDGPKALAPAMVDGWEARWKRPAARLDLESQGGGLWTAREQMSAQGGALLTQADPMPQFVFQAQGAPEDGLLIQYRLIVG
ncbi:MAG: hypothetical protein SFV54_07975 [Bryobacteraceae bacterium]|nr:hypothetical protein [Bryobacteraceae bacterium]